VSGGVELTPSWTKVSSNTTYDIYSASVPQGLSFLELFNGSNARLVPARNPNGNSELAPEQYVGLRCAIATSPPAHRPIRGT
jgi:hypothetical protein